jgi:WD40 repeat protein
MGGTGIWSLQTGRHRAALGGSTCLVPLPDGRRVAAGSGDGQICIWEIETIIKQIA